MILASGLESASQAGTLKNSVRVGDRSAMNIIGLPRGGQKRLDRRLALMPKRPRATPAAPDAPREPRAKTGSQDWFWALHSPSAAAAGPVRWRPLLETLRARRAQHGVINSKSTIRRIVQDHGLLIARAAHATGVSPALIAAVIAVESAGKVRAASHKGAQGLMQLIPATARRFGVANSFDPESNINGGAAYLNWLLARFGDDVVLALAGYNAGEGAVEKHGGVPPYRETRDYVVKVIDALVAIEELCHAPLSGPRAVCRWRLTES